MSYSVDSQGNTTQRGSDSFSWNGEEELTSGTIGGASFAAQYNGDGLRANRTIGSTTTSFVWGNGNVLDDGTQYVYGLGLVEHVTSGGTYYVLADGSGSTVALVDGSGAVQQDYGYDVWGNVTASSGSQPTEYQYDGQQTDSTGLQYLRSRYYDPTSGRFLSRDTFGSAPYIFTADNPATLTDPSGAQPYDPSQPGSCSIGAPIPPGGCENFYIGEPVSQLGAIYNPPTGTSIVSAGAMESIAPPPTLTYGCNENIVPVVGCAAANIVGGIGSAIASQFPNGATVQECISGGLNGPVAAGGSVCINVSSSGQYSVTAGPYTGGSSSAAAGISVGVNIIPTDEVAAANGASVQGCGYAYIVTTCLTPPSSGVGTSGGGSVGIGPSEPPVGVGAQVGYQYPIITNAPQPPAAPAPAPVPIQSNPYTGQPHFCNCEV